MARLSQPDAANARAEKVARAKLSGVEKHANTTISSTSTEQHQQQNQDWISPGQAVS